MGALISLILTFAIIYWLSNLGKGGGRPRIDLRQNAIQKGYKTYFDTHGIERYTKTNERCFYEPEGAGKGIIRSYEDGHIIEVVGNVPPEVIAKHNYGWTRNPFTGRAH